MMGYFIIKLVIETVILQQLHLFLDAELKVGLVKEGRDVSSQA